MYVLIHPYLRSLFPFLAPLRCVTQKTVRIARDMTSESLTEIRVMNRQCCSFLCLEDDETCDV